MMRADATFACHAERGERLPGSADQVGQHRQGRARAARCETERDRMRQDGTGRTRCWCLCLVSAVHPLAVFVSRPVLFSFSFVKR